MSKHPWSVCNFCENNGPIKENEACLVMYTDNKENKQKGCHFNDSCITDLVWKLPENSVIEKVILSYKKNKNVITGPIKPNYEAALIIKKEMRILKQK